MAALTRLTRPGRAAALTGVVAFLAGLAVAGALLLIYRQQGVGRADSQLDVTGQGVIEALHQSLRARERLLVGLAADQGRVDPGSVDHLHPLLGFPDVIGVGRVEGEQGVISWFGGSRSRLPRQMDHGRVVYGPQGAESRLTVGYLPHGPDVVLVHPVSGTGGGSWELAAIDMAVAVSRSMTDGLEQRLVWSFRPYPDQEFLVPEGLVHREYLILGDGLTWLLELEWTEETLRSMGVGVSWEAIAVAGVASLLVGISAMRFMRRRYLEMELDASQSLLEQKDLLLLALSHQLRTPLTAVIGFLALALDDDGRMRTEQREELLDLARAQAQDAAEIVEDMVVAARLQDENLVMVPRHLDPVPIVEAVFAATRKPGESLEVATAPEAIPAYADPLRIRQMVRNLFDEGRNRGARRWRVSAGERGPGVELVFVGDFRVDDPRSDGRPAAEDVASSRGRALIRPHLATAFRLAEMMGGSLDTLASGETSEIHVLLPKGPPDPSPRPAGPERAIARGPGSAVPG